MADPLAAFAADLRATAKDLDGPAMAKVLDEAGDKAVQLVKGAVVRDLGSDARMSESVERRIRRP